MPIIKNKLNELVLYLHIPKTGGTSIENALRENFEFYFKTPKNSKMKLAITAQHFDRELYIHYGLEQLCVGSFTVVRNPLDRLFSEYKHRCRDSRLINNILSFDAFALYSFDEYHKNEYLFDNHIKPQCDFLFDKTVIFKLEDGMNEISRKLRELWFYELSSIGSDNVSKGDFDMNISPLVLDKVHSFYKCDYLKLGYEFEPNNVQKSSKFKSLVRYYCAKTNVAFYKLLRRLF